MKTQPSQQDMQSVISPRFFEVQQEEGVTDMTSPQVIHTEDTAKLADMMAKMPDSFHEFFEIKAA